MINIIFGDGVTCGDCTTHYKDAHFKCNPTFGEFVDWLLTERSTDWGKIYLNGFSTILEYKWGNIVKWNTPEEKREELNGKHISLHRADGGWTRMDYLIKIVD